MSSTESLREDRSELIDESYSKISVIGKLHIIYSLDNGDSKKDIAKVYSVHPQTVTKIYKQKEFILKKYSQKYHLLNEVRRINLDHTLLAWLNTQISNDVTVTDENLLSKAQDMIQHLSVNSVNMKDWLLDFQQRYNIIKYTREIQHSEKELNEWTKLISQIGSNELYVCETCAISHAFSIDSYAAGEQPSDYVSIFFIIDISGSDKRKLAIAGKEQLNAESNIGSLPANYYTNCYINQHIILKNLQEWDDELASQGRTVFLAINKPGTSSLAKSQFKNIKLITTSLEFLSKTLEKIIECYKFQYRILQIKKKIEVLYNDSHIGLLNYINMLALAWFNVPDLFVKHIFNPPLEGSMHFRTFDTCNARHSLVQWCETYDIPLDVQLYAHCLDQYIFCDKDLKSVDLDDRKEAYELNIDAQQNSGMGAYQAVKRLLSYVQGERASAHVIQSAKLLENHIEYGALLEIHTIIDRTTSE